MAGTLALLIATRKGAFILKGDKSRRSWKVSAPIQLGHIIHHIVQDPRAPRELLMSTSTGHLGPTMLRSRDKGKILEGSGQAPGVSEGGRRPEGPRAQPQLLAHAWPRQRAGRVVRRRFATGTVSQRGRWRHPGNRCAASTSIRSTASGWATCPTARRTGRSCIPCWSIRAIRNHLYVAMSSGGVHESLDRGATWKPLVKGLAVVGGFDASLLYVHDPHCVRYCPSNPDRLYQQNHCGIYRLDRPGEEWIRIGNNMPKKVGDVGFPMVVHPRNDKVAWVFPMDGSGVWPRTSPDGRPAAYVTKNGGAKWQRQDQGLPRKDAWWTVKRQAMCGDARDPVGLYFGTTSGEIWASRDEGAKWRCIAQHLPEIYAVEVAEL